MPRLSEQDKIELIRYRHADQAKLLQSISDEALKIFSGFLTLQLALGGFLSQMGMASLTRWGFVVLELTLCSICTGMLFNNQRRRREAAKTIQNCNTYLGFEKPGFYLRNQAINARTRFWPWLRFYLIGTWVSFIGILLILIPAGTAGDPHSATTKELKTEIETVQSTESIPIFVLPDWESNEQKHQPNPQ